MNFLIKEESIKFRIENPSKRFSVESQEEGYENIVTKNKKYFSYIEKYFLNKELKNYNVIKKIKI